MITARNPLMFFVSILFQQLFVNLLILPVIAVVTNNTTPTNVRNLGKVGMSTVEIIKYFGYAVETHNVITKDGYILELHRIPKSKSGEQPTRNHPVFFHHAFLSSSAAWVLAGPNTSLAMQLADDGYDVWLANCRGNTYSRKHVSMNYKQKAFWNFSLHEIGIYDLPAAFDYILMKTNSSQLHYIGYSMGTTVFFIMASERPEYQPKIRSQISLAPVAYLNRIRSPLRLIAGYIKLLTWPWVWNGMVFQQTVMTKMFANIVCGVKITRKWICQKGVIFLMSGSDPLLFNTILIPHIMGHFPSGISLKAAEHYAQLILKENFTNFDHGPTMNLKLYNSTVPPSYNVKSIQVPITLLYGENDIVSDVKDVMKLKSELPKLLDAVKVDNPYCNHVDFIWSIKVNEHVNDPIKKILRKTDNLEWEYSGPNPSAIEETAVDNHKESNDTVKRSLSPANDLSFMEELDYLTENLDAIIAATVPRLIDVKDAENFKLEQEVQKNLFGNLIKFLRSTEDNYGWFSNGLANEFSAWLRMFEGNVNVDHEGQSRNQEFRPLSQTDVIVS